MTRAELRAVAARRRPAAERLGDAHRPRRARSGPGARLPRPRPGVHPALARGRGRGHALRRPHPLRHASPTRIGEARQPDPRLRPRVDCRRCRRWCSSEWPAAERLERRALTTVGHWRSYGSIHHDGVHYGQKAHSLRPLIDLPAPHRTCRSSWRSPSTPTRCATSRRCARTAGRLLDPGAGRGARPDAYRRFVQGSWAEFGLAKSGYAVSDSGWFSDRSACYLASGRPVIAQDTGFGRRLPTGAGLFAFTTAEDVVAAVEELERDYERHRARHASWRSSTSTPIACSARCWSGCCRDARRSRDSELIEALGGRLDGDEIVGVARRRPTATRPAPRSRRSVS